MKKKISALLLTLVMSMVLCTPAFAAPGTITAAGFYDIGTVANIEITPQAASGAVAELEADIDADGQYDEIFYANSDKLAVTYSAAKADGFYGVVLVEGTGLPTVDNTIFYIDQLTAGTAGIAFDVYPILPEETTELTLYISSNVEDLIKIPLNYAAKGEYAVADVPFVLGQVDDDNDIDSQDALMVLKISVGLHQATETEALAANVDGDNDIDSQDALQILKYSVGLIDKF